MTRKRFFTLVAGGVLSGALFAPPAHPMSSAMNGVASATSGALVLSVIQDPGTSCRNTNFRHVIIDGIDYICWDVWCSTNGGPETFDHTVCQPVTGLVAGGGSAGPAALDLAHPRARVHRVISYLHRIARGDVALPDRPRRAMRRLGDRLSG